MANPKSIKEKRRIRRKINTSKNPISTCLDTLVMLAKRRVNPITDSSWNFADQQYQELLFSKEKRGENVSEFSKRYEKIMGFLSGRYRQRIIDIRNSWPFEINRGNESSELDELDDLDYDQGEVGLI
tara:strand:- start:625 stop:1005 length:381 start_codon:yes stop_codon:yes gene_type:complete